MGQLGMRTLLPMLVLLAGCREAARFETPIQPEHPWSVATPDADQRARLEAAREYHESVGGLSMLVVQGDSLIFESYAPGNEAATPHPLWSGTKTFACALAMEGVGQGLLDLDEPAVNTLPELFDDRADITARHLLQLTSGLDGDWLALSLDGFYEAEDQRIEDKYAHALSQSLITRPGSTYQYGSVHLMVFGELMTRKLARDPLAWLETQVLDPIGFRSAGWTRDPSGNPMWPYGAWTTAAEWMRFGVLLRDDGLWQGERILPEGTLSACATGSKANPAYGLGMWLNEDPGDADLTGIAQFETEGPILYAQGPDDLVAAGGARGQRLYILPSQDMVVAILTDSREFTDSEFLSRLLE
ncbi:MAG: CubicO group peptidase (beta-lactamase class C family) [Myxococcota bacterium]|jgi:CubicO group peptidase (beta-lactamase class C family)